MRGGCVPDVIAGPAGFGFAAAMPVFVKGESGAAMRHFAFHVADDRSAEPAVRKASVRDEFEARTLAERMLRETYHHTSVEVWEESRRVWVLSAQEA